MTISADRRIMAFYERATRIAREIVAADDANAISKLDELMYEAAATKSFLVTLATPEWVEHKACEPACCNKEAR